MADIRIHPLCLHPILMEHRTRVWSFANLVRALRIILFGFWSLQRAFVLRHYLMTSHISKIIVTSLSIRSSIWSITCLQHVWYCRNQQPRDSLRHSLEAKISFNNDALVVDNKCARGWELPPIPFLQRRSQATNCYIRGNSDDTEYVYVWPTAPYNMLKVHVAKVIIKKIMIIISFISLKAIHLSRIRDIHICMLSKEGRGGNAAHHRRVHTHSIWLLAIKSLQ